MGLFDTESDICCVSLAMRVSYIRGKYETSLWPQMSRRQVGAVPSVAKRYFMPNIAYFPGKLQYFYKSLLSYYQKQTTPQNVV